MSDAKPEINEHRAPDCDGVAGGCAHGVFATIDNCVVDAFPTYASDICRFPSVRAMAAELAEAKAAIADTRAAIAQLKDELEASGLLEDDEGCA